MLVLFESHATTTDNEASLSSGWNDVDLSEFGDKNKVPKVQRDSQGREIRRI